MAGSKRVRLHPREGSIRVWTGWEWSIGCSYTAVIRSQDGVGILGELCDIQKLTVGKPLGLSDNGFYHLVCPTFSFLSVLKCIRGKVYWGTEKLIQLFNGTRVSEATITFSFILTPQLWIISYMAMTHWVQRHCLFHKIFSCSFSVTYGLIKLGVWTIKKGINPSFWLILNPDSVCISSQLSRTFWI